ncbi:MAG: ABC transporter permease [Mycobacterium leprae]
MRVIFQRVDRPGWAQAAVYGAAIALALAIAALLIGLTGRDPIAVFGAMFDGAFGSQYSIAETLLSTVPLLLCGLGIALAARMQLWNIGAEGQLYMGAFAATGVALAYPHLPAALLLPAMGLAGFIAGGIWSLLPGIARAYWKTSETITTLLLNYVGINFVSYLVYGPWKDHKSFNFPLTPSFSDNARLPLLWNQVHVGLIVALVIAALLWAILHQTRWGYEIRVIGESPAAAKYAGMSIVRNILLVMFVSGALAGLAGMMEVSGNIGRLQANISPGYGYSGIIIAYLARLNPVALIPVAFLFGGIQAGSYSVQQMGVPLATANMIQGIILFCVLGAEIFTRYRLRLVRPTTTTMAKEAA